MLAILGQIQYFKKKAVPQQQELKTFCENFLCEVYKYLLQRPLDRIGYFLALILTFPRPELGEVFVCSYLGAWLWKMRPRCKSPEFRPQEHPKKRARGAVWLCNHYITASPVSSQLLVPENGY